MNNTKKIKLNKPTIDNVNTMFYWNEKLEYYEDLNKYEPLIEPLRKRIKANPENYIIKYNNSETAVFIKKETKE